MVGPTGTAWAARTAGMVGPTGTAWAARTAGMIGSAWATGSARVTGAAGPARPAGPTRPAGTARATGTARITGCVRRMDTVRGRPAMITGRPGRRRAWSGVGRGRAHAQRGSAKGTGDGYSPKYLLESHSPSPV
ncbi:hypothetical protein A5702_13190 [Mycobacterium sp. E3339]|nr:hypothetical protein A5702_13190 [Mycobacterium sp. E3339]